MKFTFKNSFHGTTATVTTQDWRLTQRQVRRIWGDLCGDLDCPVCGYGGIEGANRWMLKKLGGNIDNNGAEVIAQ